MARTQPHNIRKLRVFISWSGSRAHAIAKSVKDFLGILNVDVFFSPEMQRGVEWRNKLREELGKAEAAIIILTPESLASQWVWYEAGAIHMQRDLRIFATLLFDTQVEKLPEVFSWFQGSTITRDEAVTRESLIALLASVNLATHSQIPDVPAAFNGKWESAGPKLMKALLAPSLTESETPDTKSYVGFARAYFPHVGDQLWTLINAMEGPAYLCDIEYNIVLANKAAELLFNLGLPPGHRKKLDDLLNLVQDTTININEVRENFEEHFKNATVPPLYHAENIFYRHRDYGFVHLRKIGQQFVESELQAQGWVVAFNIVHLDNSGAYWKDLEARMAPHGRTDHDNTKGTTVVWPQHAQALPRIPAARNAQEFVTTFEGYSARLCLSRSERETCHEFAYTHMLKHPYLLQKRCQEYDDLASFDYLAAFDKSDATNPVSVYRVRRNYHLSPAWELDAGFISARRNGPPIADVGAYTNAGLDAAIPFTALFGALTKFLSANGIYDLYIQSLFDESKRMVKFFARLGFVPVGQEFDLPNWENKWLPMHLDMRHIGRNYARREFQEEWRKKWKVQLDKNFWQNVRALVDHSTWANVAA